MSTYLGDKEYRGVVASIWNDDSGQLVAKFNKDSIFGETELGFGLCNTEYENDLKYLIDNKLDTIYNFIECGAKLEWFQNYTYRDVRLVYRERVLQVWLFGEQKIIPGSELLEILNISKKILKNLLTDKTESVIIDSVKEVS